MTAGPAFLPDTSCLVAAACAWHGMHASAASEIRRRRATGERMVVAGHSILETYAVLTRLPPPHRLSPDSARSLVSAFAGEELVALPSERYRTLLDLLASGEVAGGRSYDALIALCAVEAGAGTLLTFNPSHFFQFESPLLRIVSPAAP